MTPGEELMERAAMMRFAELLTKYASFNIEARNMIDEMSSIVVGHCSGQDEIDAAIDTLIRTFAKK